ncbi:MAG: hypothetical protein R3322_22370, partial [Kiloniellales bacterium]|nr:hypothetical protein [Kiloniellales bacterium]
AAIAALLGYFSTSPAYERFPADKAQLVLSFTHVGQRATPCRKLSRAEIEELAANMRRAEVCERARLPLYVELDLGGKTLLSATLPPTGLARDGAAHLHRRFTVAPGRHVLRIALRDSARQDGFDYESEGVVELSPGESFVVDFRPEFGGFRFDRQGRS